MRPPCEVVVRYLLPQIRARIAKVLIEEYGWNKRDVARVLAVSPSAIGKYNRIIAECCELPEETLDAFARELARKVLKDGFDPSEAIAAICRFCFNLRVAGVICHLHREQVPELAACNMCARMYSWKREPVERVDVLRSLTEAYRIASSSRAFAELVPEVRTNIVMASPNPRGVSDVAGFPGRLTVVKGKVVAISSPEFGASEHLARILLKAMESDPRIKAATCIKYTERVDKALEGLSVAYVYRDEKDVIDPVLKTIEKHKGRLDAVVDPGGYGIEPVVYVFGRDAVDAVKKAVSIASKALALEDESSPGTP